MDSSFIVSTSHFLHSRYLSSVTVHVNKQYLCIDILFTIRIIFKTTYIGDVT